MNLNELKLEELPALIADAETEVSKARYELELAKHAYELVKAKTLLRLKATSLSSQEKSAKATIDSEREKQEVIDKQNVLDIKQVDLNRKINIFIAMRKTASYKIAELKNI